MTKRQPAGIPTGGEFAANEHDESSSPLTSASPDIRLSVEDQKDRVQLLRAAAAKAESDDPKERPSGWWSHNNRGATDMAEEVLDDVRRVEDGTLDQDDAIRSWVETARKEHGVFEANTFSNKPDTLNYTSGRKTEAIRAAVIAMRGDSAAFSDANMAVMQGKETDEVIDLISTWRK